MNKERSCFMLTNIGSEIYVLGGYDGYECLREVEKIDIAEEEPKFIEMKKLSHPVKNGFCHRIDD